MCFSGTKKKIKDFLHHKASPSTMCKLYAATQQLIPSTFSLPVWPVGHISSCFFSTWFPCVLSVKYIHSITTFQTPIKFLT